MALTESSRTSINAAASAIRIRKLDTDKALVTYIDGGPNVQCRVLDISGGSISAGAENDVWSGDTLGTDYDLWVISSTKGVIFGEDNSSNDPQIRTLTVSGTTVTENTAATIESLSGIGRCFMAMVSSTVGLTCYTDGTQTRLCRFTISGDTITPGTPEHQEGAGVLNVPYGMCQLDSTRVVLFYGTPTFNNAMVQVIDISSGISKGTAVQLDTDGDISSSESWLTCVKVDTDKFIVSWKNLTQSPDEVNAIIVTTSGTSIDSQGSVYTVSAANDQCRHLGIDVISTTTVIVAWIDNSSSNVKIETLNISGTTITSNSNAVTTSTQPGIGAREHGLAYVDSDETIFVAHDTSFEVWASIISGGITYDYQHSAGGIPGTMI